MFHFEKFEVPCARIVRENFGQRGWSFAPRRGCKGDPPPKPGYKFARTFRCVVEYPVHENAGEGRSEQGDFKNWTLKRDPTGLVAKLTDGHFDTYETAKEVLFHGCDQTIGRYLFLYYLFSAKVARLYYGARSLKLARLTVFGRQSQSAQISSQAGSWLVPGWNQAGEQKSGVRLLIV